jgi:hypothetical protein
MTFGSDHFDVRRVDDKRWATINDLRYSGRSQNFLVPSGFMTDFATVPQFLLWLIPSTGAWTLAAVLHDWLIERALRAGLVSARDVDGIFRRVLREQGVSFVKRWLMWTGVRWGALFNRRRRAGWLRDLPLVVIWTLLALPVVLPASVGIGIGYAVYGLLRLLTLLA